MIQFSGEKNFASKILKALETIAGALKKLVVFMEMVIRLSSLIYTHFDF